MALTDIKDLDAEGQTWTFTFWRLL